jgi:thiosulfate dehydrogenase [quinone] large subunit
MFNQTLNIYQKLLLVTLRFFLGFIFLWAFLDKTFGLGLSTPKSRAWINGGSPTGGYLGNLQGTLASMFNSISESSLVAWLFMLGLLGVGLALILGIGMKIATASGSLMMFFIYLSQLPLKTNPFVDQHIIYILVLWVLLFFPTGNFFSLGKWWSELKFIKKNSWLR